MGRIGIANRYLLLRECTSWLTIVWDYFSSFEDFIYEFIELLFVISVTFAEFPRTILENADVELINFNIEPTIEFNEQ